MNPAHKSGMNVSRRERQDVVHELLMDVGERARCNWNRGRKSLPYLVRYGLPNRTLAYVLAVVENVVEHAVRLRSQTIPIRWIEISGCKRRALMAGRRQFQFLGSTRQCLKHFALRLDADRRPHSRSARRRVLWHHCNLRASKLAGRARTCLTNDFGKGTASAVQLPGNSDEGFGRRGTDRLFRKSFLTPLLTRPLLVEIGPICDSMIRIRWGRIPPPATIRRS